jgi:hypothetical protein
MAKPPTVSILTYCAHPALAYGTLMVFKTLRVGFPTARVEVYDNGSHPEVREQIMAACAEVDADFTSMTPRHWSMHIAHQLLERADDGAPLVLVDPDVAFWSSVEGWDFGGALMAGRLIAEMDGGPIVSRARLHPSMLWVPSLCRLRESLRADEIPQRLERAAARLEFFDTLAVAHARLGGMCAQFMPEHLDCFDHLFFGSHLPVIDQSLSDHDTVIHRCHRAVAAGDLDAIRGAWRDQDAYFAGRAAAPAIGANGLPCVELTEEERREVLPRLSARLRAPA